MAIFDGDGYPVLPRLFSGQGENPCGVILAFDNCLIKNSKKKFQKIEIEAVMQDNKIRIKNMKDVLFIFKIWLIFGTINLFFSALYLQSVTIQYNQIAY